MSRENIRDLDKHIQQLKQCKFLPEKDVANICKQAAVCFTEEPNIVEITPPIVICGDIHGQFHDMLEIFSLAGDLPDTNYVFLGDYVDRGYNSIETLLLLLCFKIKYPKRITLVRGNHEAREITQVYGFYDECLNKYQTSTVWKLCTEVFDTLPIGTLIASRILGIHGGLSPEINTIDEIRSIERVKEVPLTGALCDIMWSDPGPDSVKGWERSARGAGYLFGGDVTEMFLYTNDLHYITRAHQLVQKGFQWHFDNTLITIWSAPNYCYRCGNLAAVMQLDEKLNKDYIVFEAAPSTVRPNLADLQDIHYFL